MNLISIIIPYFKKKKFILMTLKSILRQNYKNFEIIIIYDDKDLSEYNYLKKIIKNKKKIKLFRNKNNLGVGLSRNLGIRKSRGKYIAFIDSDDLWKKNKLHKQIKFMKQNNLDFSHTSYNIINEKNKIVGNFKIKENLNYKELLRSCDIGLSTVMVKRSVFFYNKFNNFKTKEDYSLWLKLAKKDVKIKGLNIKLTNFRKVKNSLSGSIIQKLFDAYKVYYISEKFGFFTSLFFILRLTLYAIKKKIKIST